MVANHSVSSGRTVGTSKKDNTGQCYAVENWAGGKLAGDPGV